MDEELLEAARTYVSQRGMTLGRRLGFGIHGMVWVVKSNAGPARTALKVHHYEACYRREKGCYERLGEAGVTAILGFRVPRLTGCDDDLLAMELTIVKPPFLLDFAGAYLDAPPEFSDAAWEEWETRWREDWGERWETVSGCSPGCGVWASTCSTRRQATCGLREEAADGKAQGFRSGVGIGGERMSRPAAKVLRSDPSEVDGGVCQRSS